MSGSKSQELYASAVKKLQKQLQDSITGEAQNIIDGIDENFRKLKEERRRIERARQEKSRAEARKELDSLVKENNKKKTPAAALFEPGGLDEMLNKGELWRKKILLTASYQQEFPKTNKYLSRIFSRSQQKTHMDVILNYVAEYGTSYVATGDKTPDDTFLRVVTRSYEDMDSDERRGLKKKSKRSKSNKKKSNKKKSNKKKSNKKKSTKRKRKSKKGRR